MGLHVLESEEFLTHMIPVTESGCWLWLGRIDKGGYGWWSWMGGYFSAHRLSYRLFKGVPPKGWHVDHLCRVTCCVNPDHLEAVPGRVNNLRGMSMCAINARKTNCPKGHPYDETNTRIDKQGRRCCRICALRRTELLAAKRKHERLAFIGPKLPTIWVAQRMKIQCPQGHPYNRENTRKVNGARVCILCSRERWKKWDQKRQEAMQVWG